MLDPTVHLVADTSGTITIMAKTSTATATATVIDEPNPLLSITSFLSVAHSS
jgi:hypothetical protein